MADQAKSDPSGKNPPAAEPAKPVPEKAPAKVPEIGGPGGPEPTRYGDWERNGRVSDF